jgi:hypothetical protein
MEVEMDADLTDPAPLTYTVKRAVADTGYSRARLYELMAEGKFDVRKDGRKTLIIGQSLREYLAGLPAFQSTSRRLTA